MIHAVKLLTIPVLLLIHALAGAATTTTGHVVAYADLRGTLTLPGSQPMTVPTLADSVIDLSFTRGATRGERTAIAIERGLLQFADFELSGSGDGEVWVEQDESGTRLNVSAPDFLLDTTASTPFSGRGSLTFSIASDSFPFPLARWGNFSITLFGAPWSARFEAPDFSFRLGSAIATDVAAPVPLPSAVGLFTLAVLALSAFGRRQRTSS